MTTPSTTSEVLAFLARPAIADALRAVPPADLSACASCGYRPAPHQPAALTSPAGPLVVLACPSGGYSLCSRCYGDPTQRAPTAIPPRR